MMKMKIKADKNDNNNNEEKKNHDNVNDNNDESELEPYYVADLSEFNYLKDRKTVHVPQKLKNGKIEERPIILLKVLNNFYALDLRMLSCRWSIING